MSAREETPVIAAVAEALNEAWPHLMNDGFQREVATVAVGALLSSADEVDGDADAVQTGAVALLTANGADAEQAADAMRLLAFAGFLVGPESAADMLDACREQARADVEAELDDLREQLAAAHRTVAEQQDALSALRPPHRPAVTGGPR